MMGRRSLVVLYHRVTQLSHDPQGLAVDPERFSGHLRVYAEEADVVPLADVPSRTGADRRIAITFDDGYADNARTAAPRLVASGCPATFFVIASDPTVELWWDRLEHLVREPPRIGGGHLDLVLGRARFRADVRSKAGRIRTLRALNHRLRVLAPDAIEEALGEIASQVGHEARACVDHQRLAGDELRALVTRPGMTVGSHGKRHPMLATLPEDAQRQELAGSRAWLENEMGQPVDLLAYPFGMVGSYDRRTSRLARDCGYKLACTNVVGLVRPSTARFRVPRCQVWDWPVEELRTRVRQWFAELP